MVNLFSKYALALVVINSSAFSQAICPPAVFDSSRVFYSSNTSNSSFRIPDSVVFRQADGSYSESRYSSGAMRTVVQTTPNVLEQGNDCKAWPRRSLGAAAQELTIRSRPQPRYHAVLPLGAGGSRLAMVSVDTDVNRQGLVIDYFSSDRRTLSRALLSNSPNPHAFVSVDFSGDGILDIAVINTGNLLDSTAVTFLIGTADGGLTRTTTHSLGGYFDTAAPIRIDGDNLLDFSFHTYTRQFNGFFFTSSPRTHYLKNLGGGQFAVQDSSPSTFSCASAAVADFDGDGRHDLACATSNSQITVSKGLGLSGLPSPNIALEGIAATYLAAADLNKDGRMDLVAGGSGAVHTLLGDGRGSFARVSTKAYTGLDREFLIEDFDRDGNLDVVIAEGEANALLFFPESYFEVLFGTGDGKLLGTDSMSFLVPGTAIPPWSGFLAGSSGTVLVLESTGHLNVLQSTSEGRLTQQSRTEVLPIGGSRTKVMQADFDGDGLADLAIFRQFAGLYLSRNLGDARFAAATRLYSCETCVDFAVADFNRDGRTDVVISGAARAITLWNEGRGVYRSSAEFGAGVEVNSLAVGDVNFDGLPDLVFAKLETAPASQPRVSVLLGTSSGTFGAPILVAVDGDISSLSLADANADGKLEIAVSVYSRNSSNLPYSLNLISFEPGSGFQSRRSTPLPSWFTESSLNDFDGDGIPDLLFPSFHYWYFAKGRGDFEFAPFSRFAGLPRSDSFQVGDINKDGLLDLLLTTLPFQFGVSNVSVAMNRSARLPLAVSSASFSAGPIAQGSLFSIFGTKFASASTTNSSVVPPTELGGVSITVLDSQSRALKASMLFTSEGQLNAIMPVDASSGPAKLSIQTWFGATQFVDIEIADVRPGLFTVGSTGIVAANLLRVSSDGGRTVAGVVRVDSQGNLVPDPVEFGPAGEQLYLLLYGTGLKGRLNAPETRVLINGRPFPVAYAGAQGEFPGLDQVNVLLHASLAGSGLVEIQLIQTLGREIRSNVGKVAFR